ncbi:AfsR/SARP family transcriptional regulator [Nonomuraea africana]|uniref:DNA-binding SARP family transcriptional activator n=1 Tax=Nonomuraea africana TaxID=46171 RepID=A0ABR9KUV9_9ACTN|nr:BTAD domain-containing putative transcriptional regulator [Nonomuraea africana]MBE1565823.1 DNA-binding SARP family transcriptional activator [Nonomuraea africana]
MSVRFGVLGPLLVLDGATEVTPGPAKHRALLVALLMNAGRTVTHDRLVAAVWGAEPPASAEAVLRVYVSALRKIVEGIRTVPGGYLLAVDPDEVDAHRFERLVAQARRARDAGRARAAAEMLGQALGLWRGRALDGIDGELRRAHAVPLEELRLAALEERVALDLELGRGAEVIGELRALVSAYPLRERAWAQLMLALIQAGRRSEALAAYEEARGTLVAELGLEPGPELREAHERALAEESPRRVPNETPPDIADFTGRQAALGWIRAALPAPDAAPVHLVLYGPAGAGKSALAIHAARGLDLPDGRLHASLRDRTPGAVLEDLLRSLGCPDGAVPASLDERVRLYRSLVADRRVLVVLDDATSEAQVRPLLPTGAGSLTLVTSRSPLFGLEAARAYPLDVLEAEETVAMLARIVGAGRVAAEPGQALRIVRLCGALPLALRIAGSRLARRRGWTLEHLADRLGDERSRLDELSAGDLAVRSSLALGYRALSGDERLLLRRLGALSSPDFAPWIAAALVGPEGGRIMESLAEAGLLQERGLDRYGWHDLTRLYAAERLAEEEGPAAAVLAGAAGEILDRARRARELMLPAEPGSGLTLSHTVERDLATARLAESARWLAAERSFMVATVADLHRARLDEAAWRLAFYLTPLFELGAYHDDWRTTAALGLDAARRAGHRHGEALLLRSLADLHRAEGRLEEAAEALRAALPLTEQGEVARTTFRLGLVYRAQDRLPDAERCFTECLAAFGADPRGAADPRRVDLRGADPRRADLRAADLKGADLRGADPRGAADALRALGELRGDGELSRRALELYRQLGDPRGEAATLLDLAALSLAGRRTKEARQLAERAAGLSRRLGDVLPAAAAALLLAQVARAEGRPEAARTAAGEALAAFESHGDRRGRARAMLAIAAASLDLDEIDGAIDAVAGTMGEFDALGDRRGLAEAQELAREARRRRGLR